jgi:hypothetical protein
LLVNNSLVVDDDRFLRVVGSVLDPLPRFNALDGVAGLIERLSKEPAS